MTLVIKKIKTLLLIMPVALMLLGGFMLFTPQAALAQPAGCPGGPAGPLAPGTVCPSVPAGCPGGPAGPAAPGTVCPVNTSIPAGCPGGPAGPPAPGTECPGQQSSNSPQYVANDCKAEEGAELNESNCGIIKYIVIAINILAGLVGIVVAGSIIFAGIQYTTAGNDPQKVSAAKERIRNAIIALVFFIFTYAFLNYLVPGGVL